VRSPRSLLFPRLTSPSSPSLSSQQRGSSPRTIAVAPLQQVQVCPVLRAPKLDAGLAGGSQQSTGAEPPPSPCAHAAGVAAQGTIGLPGCQRSLPAHVKLLVNQHPHDATNLNTYSPVGFCKLWQKALVMLPRNFSKKTNKLQEEDAARARSSCPVPWGSPDRRPARLCTDCSTWGDGRQDQAKLK